MRNQDDVRGLSVALCGPDGVGKSTLADALESALPGETVHLHHRPGLLPAPDPDPGRDFTEPYAKGARTPVASVFKVFYLFIDWWLAWLFTIWPRVRRGDSVIIQRPWVDMAVDPDRYRLDAPRWLVPLLGRLLPDPDATILLAADPEVIAARKSELSMDELEVGLQRWHEAIGSVRRSAVVDVSGDVPSTLRSILLAIDRAGQEGNHISIQGGRWILARRPRKAAVASVGIYPPMTRRSGAVAAAARAGAELGLGRLWPGAVPPEELQDAVSPWLSPGWTYAGRRLRGGGRWFVLVLGRDGRPEFALKVGISPSDRSAIETEKETIRLLEDVVPEPLSTPELIEAPAGVMAMTPVDRQPRDDAARLPPTVAAALGSLYRADAIDGSEGWVHGDMAPWNLLWDGRRWVLVDWEASTANGRPFQDVFHWVVQGHSLLLRPGTGEIVDGLVSGQGAVGEAIAAFASAADLDPATAPAEFDTYLRSSVPGVDTTARLQLALSRRRHLTESWRGAYVPDSM